MNPGSAIKRYTKEETDTHFGLIEQALLGQASLRAIQRMCRTDPRLLIGPMRVRLLVERVHESWKTEDAHNRESWKSGAVRRLQQYIVMARGRRAPVEQGGGWLEKPDLASLARFENILAEVQGTKEAIQVNVDVRVSMAVTNVIGQLTAEQVAGYLSKYKADVADAARYRQLSAPPLLVKSTTNGSGR